MPGVPPELRGTLITPQAEDGDPPRVHAHDLGANLTEEAARAVFKRRRFFFTSLRSFWSIFRAEVLSCRFLFASTSLDGDDALGDSAPFVLQAMVASACCVG